MSLAAQLKQAKAGKVVCGMKQLGSFGFKAISASRHVAEKRLDEVAQAENYSNTLWAVGFKRYLFEYLEWQPG